MSDDLAGQSTELALLRRIDAKMDKMAARIDAVDRRAAIAGGVSGTIAGGVVAIAVEYIKAKMGW
ncbi:conserved hypothetical protein [Solidesulfovibrio fructosivorans JJ]]|uniref:Uncharacterized protein n=1 Tax=Solidesulfovibrio fructosivorans JJ] TaxID=596151 RepID=E1JU92_SOLFR|nr:hypothetical protein [Solidesulfovibrio fructosivorans]EFL52022.1 conserved hypothetical protein [Solidesulfovibrio fructosivorans JJ]]